MKADYGIDAPGVIGNLAIGGMVERGLALASNIRTGPVVILHGGDLT